MYHQRIEWTKIRVGECPRCHAPQATPLSLEEIVRQIGIDRAMKLLPELRQI